MNLDEYLAEAEIVIASLVKKYTFGYYDQDDIAQEARMKAISSFPKYDQVSPAQHFLRRCLTNDLHNLFRKMCRRTDSPCKLCAEGVGCKPTGELCAKYKAWEKTQNFRSSLINTSDISELNEDYREDEQAALQLASENELGVLIDTHLAAPLRSDYLKMLSGVGISNSKKILVQGAIRKILEEKMPCLAKTLG